MMPHILVWLRHPYIVFIQLWGATGISIVLTMGAILRTMSYMTTAITSGQSSDTVSHLLSPLYCTVGLLFLGVTTFGGFVTYCGASVAITYSRRMKKDALQ